MEAIQSEIDDRFASIVQFCIPTSSQEAKLQSCPLARQFENCVGPDADTCQSSSPDPTQPEPTPIIMVSLPYSDSSLRDEAVFVTPPDHHQHLSSSEDQNVFHECTRTVDLGDDDLKEVVKDVAETVDVNETEVVCLDDGETMKVNDTEVVCLDSVETVNMDDDTLEVIGEGSVEIIGFNAENPSKSSTTEDGGLVKQNHEFEGENANKVANLGCDGGEETRDEMGLERIVKDLEVEKSVLGGIKKRKLPYSLKGKEKIGDVVEKKKSKSGLLEFLDELNTLVGDPTRNDSKDVDFLETAKKRGLLLPRPRWWLHDGDE